LFFSDIFITGHKFSKEELIAKSIDVSGNDWFIGDTGYDALTGKKLGMKTIAVSYGFLSREVLLEYKPDFIIDNIQDITKIIS
jgi:phosphoglycolate phosphatase-like HAD superfamily hydrolase